MPKGRKELKQFADLRGLGGGFAKQSEGGGVSERRGWYPNAHYELGNNVNCDVNLLVPMASIFFSMILQLIGY